MSCFVMNAEPLAALADGIEKALNMGYNFLGLDAPETLREALTAKGCADRHGFFDTEKIFRELYGLNLAAFTWRYDGRHLEDVEPAPSFPAVPPLLLRVGYRDFHHIITPAHYKFASLLDCLIYQCDEGPISKDPLFIGLVDFRRRWLAFLVQNHEEYNKAPWGCL